MTTAEPSPTFLVLRATAPAGAAQLRTTAVLALDRLAADPAHAALRIVHIDDQIAIIAPSAAHSGPATSTVVANDTFVVAYGESDDPGDATLADRLAACIREDGLDAAAALPGCFGAVAFDAGSGHLSLLSDGLAQRSLRWARIGDVVLAAPHDMTLIAAGVPIEPRQSALASMIRFGWSFGGDSLLAAITAVPPEAILVIDRDGNVSERPHPSYQVADARRDGPVDEAATVDRIIDEMIAYLRTNHRAGTPVELELSAGFDSRAVLALALAAYPADVATFTDGPAGSQDVRIASRIARALDLPHRGGGTRASTPAERLAAVDALAMATNGQATVMPTMTGSFAPATVDSLGGDGGEVMRGYYYPKIGRAEAAPFSIAELTDDVLSKFKVGALWLPDTWDDALRARVTRRLEGLAAYCRSNADGYDLLYLLERTGTWNQKLRRMPSRRLNPFYSRAATFAFLTLPGVRGRSAAVHRAVMRRFLAPARWISLNGETFPALLSGGRIARRAATLTTLAAKAAWKVLDRLGLGRAGTGVNDLEAVRMATFRAHLDDGWFALLSAEDAVCRSVLGADGHDALLAAVRAGDTRAGQVAATLIVVETFFANARRMLCESLQRP